LARLHPEWVRALTLKLDAWERDVDTEAARRQ
jgi:hypothetical protein